MWVVMPDVPVPLLLPSDGVHLMNEVVAGSPINVRDQARNIFVVGSRDEFTQKPPTPSCQLPLAVMRLLPPLIVGSAHLGVATPPAHSHPPDLPNQRLTKQQTQPLHHY